jgi:hypothetical protein
MEYKEMSHEKERQVAEYLAKHRHELGTERLNWPPVWKFDASLLPHNEIFDDEFWAALDGEKFFCVAEQPDGTWQTGI